MWILFARAPSPDKPYWAGRRVLAALDALLWPVVVLVWLAQLPVAMGLMKPAVLAAAAVIGLRRLHVAWLRNHRYRFTTWWLARVLLTLLLIGALLKLILAT